MEKLTNPTQEEWFDMWAEELLVAGYIDELVAHPHVPTFELFPGYSKPYGKKKNTIMRPVSYTPDRIIRWNAKAAGIFYTPFDGDNEDWDKCYFKPQYTEFGNYYYSLIEVKGPTGNQKAYGSDFKFTQKWLWANTEQYVQKVMLMPAKSLKKTDQYLWNSTFTPERFLWTDKLSKLRTIPSTKGVPKLIVKTLEDFVSLSKTKSL